MAERDASEASPLHEDDSPEIVNQPSPPEEQRITSSADQQSSEVVSSSERGIASASDQDSPDSAGPSSQPSELERILLESNEAEPAEGQNYPDVSPELENRPEPDELSHSTIRGLLETAPLFPQLDLPVQPMVGEEAVVAELVRVVAGCPLVQAAIRAAKVKTVAGIGQSPKRETDQESSDDSNQQFDIDSSSISKSSPENVDLGSDTSPCGCGDGEEQSLESSATDVTEDNSGYSNLQFDVDDSSASKSSPEIIDLKSDSSSPGCDDGEEQRGLENSATDATEDDSGYSNQQFDVDDSSASKSSPENIDLESDSSPPRCDIGGEQSSGGSNVEGVDLTSESSPTKTSAVIVKSRSTSPMDIVLDSKLSPIKTGTGLEKGSSGSSGMVRGRDALMSPKRKSPTKVQHLSPKRCSPFPSPVKGASTMLSILERLDIEEISNEMESSSSDSSPGQESGMKEQTDESEKEKSDEDDGEEQNIEDSLKDKNAENRSNRDDS